MVLLGCEAGSKAYWLFDPRGGKVVVSAMSCLTSRLHWGSPGTGEVGRVHDTFVVKHLVIHGGGDAGMEDMAMGAASPEAVLGPNGPANHRLHHPLL